MSKLQRRVIVIGGSIAGLFTGVLLRRLGWHVDIFERAGEALASRGAGITTHDELYAALAQAGIEIDRELAIESSGRTLLDHAGRTLAELDMPQWMTSWGLLYRFLRERFDDHHYHDNMGLTAIEQNAEKVTAHFANGEQRDADFLIGADGMRSTTRRLTMPEATIQYAGYAAWRGLAAEADLPAHARARTNGRFLLCLPPNEHMLGYMVAGPHDTVAVGERNFNWVWYRPAPQATRLRELLTGSDNVYYETGIPHHLIKPRFVAELREDAKRLIAPALEAALAQTPQPFLQPIYEVASRRLVSGRVIVLGDAAFCARPHIGLGVSKAADDAAQLALAFAAVGQDFQPALAQWERKRLAFGTSAVRHSRDLGCYLDGLPARDSAAQAQRDYFRQPHVVLARIAARDPYQFLD